jgi:hypothetical protein
MWSYMYIGSYGKCPLFKSYFNKIWIPGQIFEKYPDIKLTENPLQWEPSCSMRTDGQIDKTELLAILRTRLKMIQSVCNRLIIHQRGREHCNKHEETVT